MFSPPTVGSAAPEGLTAFNLFSTPESPATTAAVVQPRPYYPPQLPASTPKALRKRVVMLTATWCAPCKDWHVSIEPGLRKQGWSIGEGPHNQIQVIDIDKDPALARQFADFNSVPTFVLVEDETAKETRVGKINGKALLELWNS